MPVYNADKLAVLRQLMLEKAQAEKQAIQLELEHKRAAQLEKVKDQALQDAYQVIQSQRGNINVQAVSALSQKSGELRKQLIRQRDNYAQAVFDEVKSRLEAFSAGKEYGKYLENSLQNAAASGLFDKDEETLIRVSARDLQRKEEIQKAFGFPCCVKADETIELGGFIAESREKGIALDRTLDQKLEQQKEWFYGNSGFLVEASF